MGKAGVSLKPWLPPQFASIHRISESQLLCVLSHHPTEICVENREEEIPKNNKEGQVKGRAFFQLGPLEPSFQPLPDTSLPTSRAACPTLSLTSILYP